VARAIGTRPNRIAWTYVSGLVSALDTRLLSQRATLELLNADGLPEVLGRVRATVMFADLPDTAEPFALAEAMQAAYAAFVRRMAGDCPARAVADLFLLPIEWQAFRGYLREKALGLERGAGPGSATPDAVWDQCWAGQETDEAFAPFAAAAAAIRDAGPREERTPQLVDGVTQLYEARSLRQAAEALGSPGVAAWVGQWLQLRLALALLRSRFQHWADAVSADALDELGDARETVRALAAEGQRDWRPVFTALGLAAAQTLGDDEPVPAAGVERLSDDWMTDATHAGRGVAFGPEPVFAFLWGLRIEALNLKSIVAGVAAGLSRDAIARDIRQTYG